MNSKQIRKQKLEADMGSGDLLGATPRVKSASLQLKLYNFLEGALIEVAQ
jgi:hypothetical protein